MSALKRISEWVADAPCDWSGPCTKMAISAFADTAACMIAGSGDASTRAVAASVTGNSRAARVVTGGGSFPAPFAALINGTAAHALDFDDVLDGANTHASAVLVPAILALGDEGAATGAACLDAYLVGIEVMACLGHSLDLTHYTRGWHATSTIGTVAAAAACARLLRLAPSAASNAISISVSMSSGTKAQFGTATKPFHAGMAAMNGVLAAQLARAGLEAADNVLDGPWGLHSLYGGNEEKKFSDVVESLGADTSHVLSALRQKAYPCCFSNHQAIMATTQLRKIHNLSNDNISKIQVELPSIYSENLAFYKPSSIREAQFCLEYCVATAFLYGNVTTSDFTVDALANPVRQALMAKIHRLQNPRVASASNTNQQMDVTVKVVMQNGNSVSENVMLPPNLTDNKLKEKFTGCALPYFSEEDVESLQNIITNLTSLEKISDLTRFLPIHEQTYTGVDNY